MFKLRILTLLVALGQPLLLQAVTISNQLSEQVTIYGCKYYDSEEESLVITAYGN